MAGPEATIEREGMATARKKGWFETKLMQCSIRGMPDRLMGRIDRGQFLVEWKKNGKPLTEQQELRHKELRDAGFTVLWFDNLAEFYVWLA